MADSILGRFLARLFPTAPVEAKSSASTGLTLPGLHFMSPDGTRTIYRLGGSSSEAERVTVETAYAAAAYAYVAMRWRAERMAEPPLMIVSEDQVDGTEEWLPKHPLAKLLDAPNDDCDLSEMLYRTSLSLDMYGQALWLKDSDRGGRPARLTLFSGCEFSIERTKDRIRGIFRINSSKGQTDYAPEQVVYFHDPNPTNWLTGTAKLDIALSWLNLGQTARATVRDLLVNSLSPSLIVQPDPAWNPDQEEFTRFKAALDDYATPGQRGKALTMLGGGTATVVSARISDLIPGDLLNRVESVVSSVFGVPAIVLQFLVGMENSPWSQMAQARRMAYEDTAEPLWKSVEKALTRQLLRPMDPDPTNYIRYDRTQIPALQADRAAQITMAVSAAQIASPNERRALAGFEPVDGDPEADKMPWIAAAEAAAVQRAALDAAMAARSVRDWAAGPAANPAADPAAADVAKATRRVREAKRDLWAALRADQIASAEFDWALAAARELETDQAAVLSRAAAIFGTKAEGPTPAQRKKFVHWVEHYFETTSPTRWTKAMTPLAASGARRAATTVAADLGFSFDVVQPGIAAFAAREVGFLVTSISSTTRDAIVRAVTVGLESGGGTEQIARDLKESSFFSRPRAMLIARTEAGRVMNGAPTEMLKERARATGRRFEKTWVNSGDDRVRDEHQDAPDGVGNETVGVDEAFSNGLEYPDEPNCRCVVTFGEAET